MFKTIGHQKQKDFLQNLLNKNSYSHAYLFSGPSEIGKRTLALEFAIDILGIKSDAHPDLISIDAAQLAVAEIRELLATLSLAPYSAPKKVLIINNFEQASREVSNSLLKTIEEPSASTIIILITNNYKALLPTVVSRTQRLHFAALSTAEIAAAVPGLKKPESLNGRIGQAIRISKDKDYAARFDAALLELQTLKQIPTAERLLQIKKLFELEDAELDQTLHWWAESEQANLPANPKTYININSVAAALSGLRRNFNKKLVLQKMLLEIIS